MCKYRSLNLVGCCIIMLFMSACASYGIVENVAIKEGEQTKPEYSVRSHAPSSSTNDISMTLSFSGGGTRAAALAYGVMQELRDTTVTVNGEKARLLDQIDAISSVSGGSFPAAYYGLHGDGLFDTFEDAFLRYDFDKPLLEIVLNPFHWFTRKGRTERAIELYEKKIFHGATYADMLQPGRPLIVINSSDFSHGVRFSFLQDYFDLLCSDLLTFPVARAVTASSAVPVLFNPVVVENYSGCNDTEMDLLKQLRQQGEASNSPRLEALADGLLTYNDKEHRKYIHFVDGGITDNMGLRAISDVIAVAGGVREFTQNIGARHLQKLVLITIDASTNPQYEMDDTNKQPSMVHSMGAVTGVQLHRYNIDSLELIENSLHRWADDLSTPESQVTPYFIEVSFKALKHQENRQFFNLIPTSFSLSNEEVDKLIEAGRQLLRENPAYQQLLADLSQP